MPYRGSAIAISELIRGEIQLACPPVAAMTPFMKNDKLRVLGVTTKEPTELAPGQPPIARALPGYVFPGWYGAFMPRNTPRHIVERLHKEFARTLEAPEMRERLRSRPRVLRNRPRRGTRERSATVVVNGAPHGVARVGFQHVH